MESSRRYSQLRISDHGPMDVIEEELKEDTTFNDDEDSLLKSQIAFKRMLEIDKTEDKSSIGCFDFIDFVPIKFIHKNDNMQDYEPQFQLRKVELKINSNNKLLLNGENENYDIIQRMEFRNNFCFILTKTYDVFLIGNFSNTQSYILKHCGLMPETFKCAKSKISDITCNNSCVLLLSKDGMVYSWGKDINKCGVLGIGKGINEELNPSPIMSLIDYRIININIDETKAWAISNDGKLFIWGMFNTSQYINNPKFTINENLISNDIIIPTPLFVDILQPYFITKATPFSNLKDESLRDIGTNICFKYYDNNQMFGLILGYNPRINSGKQEAFLSSVSFLEQPCSPIDPYGRRFSK